MDNTNVIIRTAERKDCESIANLIKELADYEKQPQEAKLNATDLERDGFDANPPYFRSLVAQLNDAESGKATIIGYGLYYYDYNTWQGKSIHLEDFYVTPNHRFKGVGEMIMRELAKIAENGGFTRITFECLEWNEPALKFYRKHGAEDLTIKDGWLSYRFVNSVMKKLSEL